MRLYDPDVPNSYTDGAPRYFCLTCGKELVFLDNRGLCCLNVNCIDNIHKVEKRKDQEVEDDWLTHLDDRF